MTDVTIIGIRGHAPFDEIIKHFTDLGGDVILMDPNMVYGARHIQSSVMHADRAFSQGKNRSKSILTEIILYAAGDRQIGKALEKMKPKKEQNEIVAIVIGVNKNFSLEKINMKRCDEIICPTSEKAKCLGFEASENLDDDFILEQVAMVDLMKQ